MAVGEKDALLKPQWIRAKDVPKVFGVGMGRLREWMAAGKVRNISLREPGQAHATRLVDYASMSALLESMAEGGAR